MKKILSLPTILLILLFASDLFAHGGIFENNNHSSEFLRTANRNASTEVDAVYFNPAGTVKLSQGFHVGLMQQTVMSKKTITDDGSGFEVNGVPASLGLRLPRNKYKATPLVPVFPSIHMVYRTGDLALMAGFDIMTGGGTGNWDDGIPFTDYLGMLAAVNYASALVEAGAMTPREFATADFSSQSEMTGYFAGPALTMGFAYAISDLLAFSAGYRFIYGMGGIEAKVTPYLNGQKITAAKLKGDATLEGNTDGIVLGLNISPSKALNIGIRYEHFNKWELEQSVHSGKDLGGILQNGSKTDKTPSDNIAFGASCHVTPKLRIEGSYGYFFNDKQWAKDEEETFGASYSDGYEYGAAIEYALISQKLLFSVGFDRFVYGKPDETQTDFGGMKLDGLIMAAGGTYFFSPDLSVTIGVYDLKGDDTTNMQGLYGSEQKFTDASRSYAISLNSKL